MKIILLSNYFNHHQREISRELFKIAECFEFVATSEMREERKILGYGEENIPSCVNILTRKNEEQILKNIEEADIVIRGAAPSGLTVKRPWKNNIIFRYSERQLKRKECFLRYIPRFLKWHLQEPMNRSIYLLCASAYASYDFSKYFMFKNKAYKWGYFPETKHYDIQKLLEEKKKHSILWCGRFLDWKHPEDIITVAKRLKDEGYEFEINYIGTGVLEDRLIQLVNNLKLGNEIHFLGTMKPQLVRKYMEQAGIYLFTSDKREGWGAVLNESMNSGCAVVASHAIGAVPYLVKNNENGLIYGSGNVEMLYKKVKYLLDNPNEQKRLGEAAYHTIVDMWNAKVAVERFINLAEKISNGEKYPDIYESGPCSKAEIIKDDWFSVQMEEEY